MLAPGRTAPLGSLTLPEIAPVSAWAEARRAASARARRTFVASGIKTPCFGDYNKAMLCALLAQLAVYALLVETGWLQAHIPGAALSGPG